jgi:hypothetical protein
MSSSDVLAGSWQLHGAPTSQLSSVPCTCLRQGLCSRQSVILSGRICIDPSRPCSNVTSAILLLPLVLPLLL